MVQTNLPALLLSSFAAFFFLLLLAIVLIANTKSFISRLFSIFLLSGFAWGLFDALLALNVSPKAEFVANVSYAVLGFLLADVIHFIFCLVYLGKPWKKWLFYLVPVYLLVSFWLITGKVTLVASQPFAGGLGFHNRQIPGSMLTISALLGGSVVIILFYYLFRELLKKGTDGIHRQKVKLLLLATVAGAVTSFLTSAIPFFWAYPLDILGELAAACILTYAILRFELVDVSTKLRNVIVEFVFTGLLTAFYLIILINLQLLFHLDFFTWPTFVLAVFLTSFSQPLKERLLNFVDITFYRTRYDYRETLNNFSKRVGEILDIHDLSLSIKKTVKDTFQAKEVYLFVFASGTYRSITDLPFVTFSTWSPFVKYLKTSNKLLTWEANAKELNKFPETNIFPFKLLIPLISGKDLVGILFIGQRLSNDFYSQEDKNLLSTLANASAIAVKNSLLYSEVVEQKQSIQKLYEHEHDVNESKDQFVAIASHFLRTPLTSLKGFLSLLLDKNLKEDERVTYAQEAFNVEKKLATLVEDLVSISSLERGELKLYKTKVNLTNVVDKIVDDNTSLAVEKRVKLKAHIKKETTLMADEQKLTQALSNLVDNALKFTSVGTIDILVDSNNENVEIFVKDTGIGIDPSQVDQLFQKFRRATSIRTYNYEGSGLGLYITKLIIDAHQGKITVLSKLGQGSTFGIYLPVKTK